LKASDSVNGVVAQRAQATGGSFGMALSTGLLEATRNANGSLVLPEVVVSAKAMSADEAAAFDRGDSNQLGQPSPRGLDFYQHAFYRTDGSAALGKVVRDWGRATVASVASGADMLLMAARGTLAPPRLANGRIDTEALIKPIIGYQPAYESSGFQGVNGAIAEMMVGGAIAGGVGVARSLAASRMGVVSSTGVNADLAVRTLAYKAWKSDAGIAGQPTAAQFELFPSSVRIDNPGFARYSGKEWPPEMGFRSQYDDFFEVGMQFDRYGLGGGRFVSPLGESYRGRSLRPGTDLLPYTQYETTVSMPVNFGPARSWFGYEGGATQAMLPESIDSLLAKGWIRQIEK
jgi:hypothetical protein